MDKQPSFKQLADQIMEPLDVSPELKSKTLRLAEQRNRTNGSLRRFIQSGLIGAAMLACFSVGTLWDSMPWRASEQTAVTETAEIGPTESVNTQESSPPATQIGDNWKMPEYVPDGYRVQSVDFSSEGGFEVGEVRYEANDNSFTLTRSNKLIEPQVNGEQAIDLRGTRALVRAMPEGGVEIRWSVDAYTYKLQGNLTQEEAVRIADSSLR